MRNLIFILVGLALYTLIAVTIDKAIEREMKFEDAIVQMYR